MRDSIIYEFSQSADNTKSFKQFWNAFKQSNYGDSNYSINKTVQNYIENIQELYLETPDAEKWGLIKTIWADEYPWMNSPLSDWSELSEELIAKIQKPRKKVNEIHFYLRLNILQIIQTIKRHLHSLREA